MVAVWGCCRPWSRRLGDGKQSDGSCLAQNPSCLKGKSGKGENRDEVRESGARFGREIASARTHGAEIFPAAIGQLSTGLGGAGCWREDPELDVFGLAVGFGAFGSGGCGADGAAEVIDEVEVRAVGEFGLDRMFCVGSGREEV